MLRSIEVESAGKLKLALGVAAFKEFFFTHHFADYVLSRSSSKDSGEKKTLRNLFSPVYERSYAGFFCGGRRKLEFLPYTPNTLGVTGCVRVVFDERQLYFFQYRGQHESAARGVLHLSYAGTLDAYPKYVRKEVPVSIADLASDEYEDEFFCASPGRTIATRDPQHMVRHEMVGICANSQYLFQPEIFILTTITLNSEVCMDELKGVYENRISGSFVALPSIESLDDYLIRTDTKLRPLCRVAIDRIYLPRIAASDVMAEAC